MFCLCLHTEIRLLYTVGWEALYSWYMGCGWGVQVCRYGLWHNGRVWILGIWGDVLWQGHQYWISVFTVRKYVFKLKQESSDNPFWVQSEEKKDRNIDDYRRPERIYLDKASISKNAEQRSLAKLKLNSMWSKWAQNQTKTQTNIVDSEKEF